MAKLTPLTDYQSCKLLDGVQVLQPLLNNLQDHKSIALHEILY